MKKMILILLLFITLTCSVCETFEVRSAQSFYQVFKNENVTLEWTFTDSSLDSLHFTCFVTTGQKLSALFIYFEGDVVPPFGPFKGRVQLDKDVLRERRIRLHVSSLRTEDSGRYSCDVETREGLGEASCNVTVTDTLQTAPETGTETGPEPEDRNTRTGVWTGLIFGPLALVLCVCCIACVQFYKRTHTPCKYFRKNTKGNNEDGILSEAGPILNVSTSDETRQTEVSALRETVDNSTSVRSHGHHVPTEHERHTLKLTEQETCC